MIERLHDAMDVVYDLGRSSGAWIESVRAVSQVFAPSARLHLHLVEAEESDAPENLLERFTDDAVARLASGDVLERLSEPEIWVEHASLAAGNIAIDVEVGEARAVALVENADKLTDSEFASIELFLHHWEASFLLRRLLDRLSEDRDALEGMRVLMRHLRQEAEYMQLSEDCSAVWRGILDGSWTLVELDRNQSRWQFVVKENPRGHEDPRALSRRESQVLRRAARGEANKLIAHDLDLEESTVGSYLQRALAKLQLTNRVELVSLHAALVAYEGEDYRRKKGLREESVGVLDALDRLERPDSKIIVANLREMVTRLK